MLLSYFLDEREKDLRHFAEAVLLAAVEHVSSTTQGRHFIHQALLTALLQHNLQHLRDGGLTFTRLLQLWAKEKREAEGTH